MIDEWTAAQIKILTTGIYSVKEARAVMLRDGRRPRAKIAAAGKQARNIL
jgi:hypothetical protein